MTTRGCQQRSIRRVELRPRDLPTQDLGFVPEHQAGCLSVQAAAATNKRAEQTPDG